MKKILLSIGITITALALILVGISIIKGKTDKVQNPIATIEIEGYEKPIKIELDPQSAPNTVANFIKLANSGFYNNYKMSIEESSITASDSKEAQLSNIQENPAKDYVYGIKGEFIRNGVDNLIKHKKGIITMEREDYSYFGYAEEGYNSANSKFSILTKDVENYNGIAAAFGKVIEGEDVLDAIAATRVEDAKDNSQETKPEDEGKNTITIKSVTVDTFGVDYGMPEVVNITETRNKINQIYQQYMGTNQN